ncbi:MAG: tetratricopeptide repeat protein [Burkholderiaceae bacterium]
MTERKLLFKRLLALTCLVASIAVSAAEPSMAQIYQAAEAGNLTQAQSMIRQVLQDHPDSAKAHFVDAELLARQGQLAAARSELQSAQRLAPGLPFAKASAVAALQNQVNATPRSAGLATMTATAATRGPGIWLPMLALGGIMAVGYFFFRNRNRPSAATWNGDGMAVGSYGPSGNGAPASFGSQPYGMATPGAPAAPGAGLGSGMLGGLAAGVAAGAGMVAGQALMHRMMDANGSSVPLRSVEPQWDTAAPGNDMGGDNFGITDAGSWDDAGSGGDAGSEWG